MHEVYAGSERSADEATRHLTVKWIATKIPSAVVSSFTLPVGTIPFPSRKILRPVLCCGQPASSARPVAHITSHTGSEASLKRSLKQT
jgi:hypothetical protein